MAMTTIWTWCKKEKDTSSRWQHCSDKYTTLQGDKEEEEVFCLRRVRDGSRDGVGWVSMRSVCSMTARCITILILVRSMQAEKWFTVTMARLFMYKYMIFDVKLEKTSKIRICYSSFCRIKLKRILSSPPLPMNLKKKKQTELWTCHVPELKCDSLRASCHHNTLEVAKLLCICQWAGVYDPRRHVALHKLHSELHPQGRVDMKEAQSKNMIAIM